MDFSTHGIIILKFIKKFFLGLLILIVFGCNKKLNQNQSGKDSPFMYSSVYLRSHFNKKNPQTAKLNALGNFYPKGWAVHTLPKFIPADKYFATHPEYFGINPKTGKRDPKMDPCLTNREVIKKVTQKTKEILREYKDAKYLSISQRDGGGLNCHCDSCSKLMKKEGSYSGPLLYLVNEVAKSISKSNPRIKLTTLAYKSSYKPPSTIVPAKNVAIRLCTDKHAWKHQFISIDKDREWLAAAKKWRAITQELHIWDYIVDFSNIQTPHPNYNTVAENIRLYKSIGVDGVLLQGLPLIQVESHELKSYVFSNLLLNPKADPNVLIKEYCTSHFTSKVAKAFIEYHQELQGILPSNFRGKNMLELFNHQNIRSLIEILEKGRALAKKDNEIVSLEKAKINLLYTLFLLPEKELQNYKVKPQNISEFKSLVKKHKNHQINNKKKIDDKFFDVLQAKINTKVPTQFNTNSVFLQEQDFKIHTHFKNVKEPIILKDGACQNGYSLKQPGGHALWNLGVVLGKCEKIAKNRKYKIQIRVKADIVGKDGLAFTFGIYDKIAKKNLLKKPVLVKELSKSYKNILLGTIQLTEDQNFFIHPAKNLKNISNHYIDYIELIPVN